MVANWHRDQSRRQIISIDDILHWHTGDAGPEWHTQLIEDKDTLLTAIRRLPTDRQELLVLKFVDRLSNKEIGAIMNRSEGAIKSLYHRTLLSLRDDITQKVNVPSRTNPLSRIKLPWRKQAGEEPDT